jgi:hypothetical protein
MNVRKSSERKKPVSRKVSSQKRGSIDGSAAGESKSGGFLRAAINVFIIFHLVAITCWALPLDIFPTRAVKKLVRPYMVWTGLFQSWDTFAPNPIRLNSYAKAAVITENHHIKVWAFPRMEELSFSERYRKERYRKFAEVLIQQKNAILWPDAAKHLARTFDDPADLPDKVILIQFLADINPPGDKSPDPIPTPKVFYEDYVQPEDLK